METGQQGTGKYEGATWDGKRWMRDGEPVKIGPWQQTGVVGKTIIISVSVIAVLAVAIPYALR